MSKELIEQYRLKHERDPDYGSSRGQGRVDFIRTALGKRTIRRVLNFGAGKSPLLDLLWPDPTMVSKVNYDPAIQAISASPTGAFDLVISTDVLEHIPEDELPAMIERHAQIARGFIHLIHFREAKHRLPNGENCHATQRGPDWWLATLEKHSFESVSYVALPEPFHGWFVSLWDE